MASSQRDSTRSIERARRHALENQARDLKIVQELEDKMNITTRWDSACREWQETGRLVANRKYQRALDQLEGLVVARMFELTKMNRSETGKHLLARRWHSIHGYLHRLCTTSTHQQSTEGALASHQDRAGEI